MEAIRSWAVTVCLSALAAGMAGIVAPNGNLEKAYRFAVSLFFLCCLVLPLFELRNINLNLNLATTAQQQNYETEKTVYAQIKEESESSIAEKIRSLCSSQGVQPENVKVTLGQQTDHKYFVKSVTVTLKSSDIKHSGDIAAAVKKELGLDIKVNEGEQK